MCCRLQIEIAFIIPYPQERDTGLCLYQCGYYPRYWVNLHCEPFIFVSAGTFCYVSSPCNRVCVETNNDGR